MTLGENTMRKDPKNNWNDYLGQLRQLLQIYSSNFPKLHSLRKKIQSERVLMVIINRHNFLISLNVYASNARFSPW